MSKGKAKPTDYFYDKLIKNEKDHVGLIAYAKIKRAEQEYLDKYRAKHNCEDVPYSVIEDFNTLVSGQLSVYQTAAQQLSDECLHVAEHRILTHLKSLDPLVQNAEKMAQLHDKLNEPKGYKELFGFGFAQNIVASLVFTLAIGAFIYFLQLGISVNIMDAGNPPNK